MIRRAVQCDGCGVIAEHEDGPVAALTAKSARSDAKEFADWHHSKGKDLCDDCWERGTR